MQGKSIIFAVNNRLQGLGSPHGAAGSLEDGDVFALCSLGFLSSSFSSSFLRRLTPWACKFSFTYGPAFMLSEYVAMWRGRNYSVEKDEVVVPSAEMGATAAVNMPSAEPLP